MTVAVKRIKEVIVVARFWSETTAVHRGTVATKSDSKAILAHIRGWDIGVEVTIFVNEDGEDEIIVRPTGGSNKPTPGEIVYQGAKGEEKPQLISTMKEFRIRVPKHRPVQVNTQK